jgi:hypothetical protein
MSTLAKMVDGYCAMRFFNNASTAWGAAMEWNKTNGGIAKRRYAEPVRMGAYWAVAIINPELEPIGNDPCVEGYLP